MKWAMLLGSADISGGTYVIFEHCVRARRRGADVTIVTEKPVKPTEYFWHPEAAELRFRTFDEVEGERFDLAIATWWRTIFELHRVEADAYGYFVQSIESRFYDDDELPVKRLADSTYALGLPVITEATWIQRYLKEAAAVDAQLVRNGIRKDVYTESGSQVAPRAPGKLRVLVEGPVDVGFKNVPQSIEAARAAGVDEVWLLTSSKVSSVPGVDRVFSRVPIFETPPIYRSCDVLVKLSYVEGMFGPPLEEFHCGGTALVYEVTGHDEYIVDGQNALVATRGDAAQVTRLLAELKAEPRLLERLQAGARDTARAWWGWEEASVAFEAAVEKMATQRCPTRDELRVRTQSFMNLYAVAEEAHQAAKRYKALGERKFRAHFKDALRYGKDQLVDRAKRAVSKPFGR